MQHPLNRKRRARALIRYVSWQLRTAISDRPVVVTFIDDAKLLLRRGQTGATGNLYTGLHEFPEMGFVLHALRADDLFVDVGANVGSYTVLAAAAVGSRCIAFEPSPDVFAALRSNVALNGVTQRVELVQAAVGAARCKVRFTTGLGPMNHVVVGSDAGSIEIEQVTLDSALGGRVPRILKLDAEGRELDILRGAPSTMQAPELTAVVMETFSSTDRNEETPHSLMESLGFVACSYDPLSRTLCENHTPPAAEVVIYVRDKDEIANRIAGARRYTLPGRGLI